MQTPRRVRAALLAVVLAGSAAALGAAPGYAGSGRRTGSAEASAVGPEVSAAATTSTGMATTSATRRPTKTPTTSPTKKPTKSPTKKPTTKPTKTPTGRPPTRPAPTVSTPGATAPAGSWWRPSTGLSWQWQLTGELDLTVPADVYDLDAFDTTTAQVATLHRAGRKVICYVNVGAYEEFRPDAAKFPAATLGRPLDGWPGERWLDVRQWDALRPILAARFQQCRDKGFDAVEPDNVDGYANRSGFPLTSADQLTYNRRIAELAHRLGLAVGLKNDLDQAAALQPAFDFAVNEECARYAECAELKVFVTAGKPVFHVEYDVSTAKFCPKTTALRFSSMRKHLDLDRWREVC